MPIVPSGHCMGGGAAAAARLMVACLVAAGAAGGPVMLGANTIGAGNFSTPIGAVAECFSGVQAATLQRAAASTAARSVRRSEPLPELSRSAIAVSSVVGMAHPPRRCCRKD